jgi:S-adenosylmethionine hydrolase
MAALRIITLLTDFGTTDAYVGIVKGVLLTRAPEARIHSRAIYAPAAAALISGVG